MSAEDFKEIKRQIAKTAARPARMVQWVNNSALVSSNANSITSTSTASSFTTTLEISKSTGISAVLAAASLSQFLPSTCHTQANSMISAADTPPVLYADDFNDALDRADTEIQGIFVGR